MFGRSRRRGSGPAKSVVGAALATAMLVLAVPTEANAFTCVARVESKFGAVSETWSAAVDELNASLPDRASDCAEVVVLLDVDGAARVRLTTEDGRTALRSIGHPLELGPVVRALLVRSANDGKPDREDRAPPSSTSSIDTEPVSAPVFSAPAPRDSPRPSIAPHKPSIVLSVAAGLGLPAQEFASPVGQVRAAVVLDRWEVGAFGHWEVTRHVTNDGSPHHATLGSVGGGASGGRRESLGPILAVFGGTFAIHANQSSFRDLHAHLHDECVEPRVGGYVGAVFPKAAPVRLRTELAAELALSEHTSQDLRLPEMPSWWTGLTLGVEIGVSP